jgi:hypothetical protein
MVRVTHAHGWVPAIRHHLQHALRPWGVTAWTCDLPVTQQAAPQQPAQLARLIELLLVHAEMRGVDTPACMHGFRHAVIHSYNIVVARQSAAWQSSVFGQPSLHFAGDA